MNLTNYERETIVNYNEAEALASVYTHNAALKRQLAKCAIDWPDECRQQSVSHNGQAVDYLVPKSWIKVHPPRKANISDEQREKMRERMQRINAGKARVQT